MSGNSAAITFTSSPLSNLVIGLFKIFSMLISELVWILANCLLPFVYHSTFICKEPIILQLIFYFFLFLLTSQLHEQINLSAFSKNRLNYRKLPHNELIHTVTLIYTLTLGANSLLQK